MTSIDSTAFDLDAATAELAEHGYCIVEGVLSPEETAAARSRLVAVAQAERDAGIAGIGFEGPDNQRVWCLLNKGPEFVALAHHPVAMQLMTAQLGPQFLLSSITANIAGPGGPPMMLHTDQGYVPQPWPPSPLVSNIMWMLDDFTEANGATRIVPRSHRTGVAAETVAMTAPAGSICCFDGRVLHQTGANSTADERRHGVLTYYCAPYIRQQENFSLSLLPEVWPTLPPVVRDLVGLKVFGTLGMIDGPSQRGFRY